MNTALTKARTYADLVMFGHSLFGLPFAYLGAILATRGRGPITWQQLLWITFAMVGARNGANALNRLIDHRIDALNPRTRMRHLPQGIVSRKEVALIAAGCLVLFAISAAALNPLCLKLLPLALTVLVVYSFTKRFTWASHLVLGSAVGMAPMGGWIAIREAIELPTLVLGAAVGTWVAGFDIIYATLDIEFDRQYGLHSIPARFGRRGSLLISAFLHGLTIVLFLALVPLLELGAAYIAGCLIAALLLWYEHALVSSGDIAKVQTASYTVNQLIAPIMFLAGMLDMILS